MCGVFGFQYPNDPEAQPTWQKRSVIAMFLALETESRGRDASGFAYFDADEAKVMFRRDNTRYSQSALMVETVGATNLIGHCRYATVGAKVVGNAHPWHLGHIVGSHNGGIFNYKEIGERYPERKYEVDSMHLIRHISDDLDTKELEGYGTVEWFDIRDPGAVYLCAMNRGDLHIEVLAKKQGVVWASTRGACASALGAVDMYQQSKALLPKENVVYRIADGKIAETEKRIYLTSASRGVVSKTWGSSKWVQGTDGIWRDPDADKTGLPFGCSPVTTPRITDNTPSTDGAPEYEAAVAAYEKELSRIMGGAESGMTRRQRRRFDKLMSQTENHQPHCHCSFCMEIFRLAASGT